MLFRSLQVEVDVVAGAPFGTEQRRRFAGSGANQLYSPLGITTSANGTLLVADQHNHRVVEWAPGATEGTVAAGSPTCCTYGYTDELLYYPDAVAADTSGVFVADRYHRVVKWEDGATAGVVVAGVSNSAGSGLERLYNPMDLRLVGDELYIADYHNHRVVSWAAGATAGQFVAGYSPSGGRRRSARLECFSGPRGVDVFNGTFAVASYSFHRVTAWKPSAQGAFLQMDMEIVAGGNGHGWRFDQQIGRAHV